MRNILLKIEYDGTGFHGWQRQPGLLTVQGELERALRQSTGISAEIEGTSRTDAGVHALGQMAYFCFDSTIPADRIPKAMNGRLPGDIRVLEATEKPLDFHVRAACKGKTYIYKMREELGAFDFRYAAKIRTGLDSDKMAEAAKRMEGTHDFKCFQSAGGEERLTTVRTIKKLEVKRVNSGFDIIVTGDGFLYNMVRIIAGTLLAVGEGKIEPESIDDIIKSGDRARAGTTAPPQGLYLAEIYF